MEISTFSCSAKWAKLCLTFVLNGPNSKKILDTFYPNKKGLFRSKNISRYCPFNLCFVFWSPWAGCGAHGEWRPTAIIITTLTWPSPQRALPQQFNSWRVICNNSAVVWRTSQQQCNSRRLNPMESFARTLKQLEGDNSDKINISKSTIFLIV
jgi:hypothetical protein